MYNAFIFDEKGVSYILKLSYALTTATIVSVKNVCFTETLQKNVLKTSQSSLEILFWSLFDKVVGLLSAALLKNKL